MVDVALDLPSSLKLRRLTDRFVLRHVARRLAPRSLACRRERERSWRLRDFLVERSGIEWTGNTLGALLAADEIEAAGVLNPRFVHKLCERVAAERGETFLAVQHERLLLWCVSFQLLHAQLVRGEHAPRAATAASDLQLVTRSPWPDAPGGALPPLARARSA
jgi:hypothetical protein